MVIRFVIFDGHPAFFLHQNSTALRLVFWHTVIFLNAKLGLHSVANPTARQYFCTCYSRLVIDLFAFVQSVSADAPIRYLFSSKEKILFEVFKTPPAAHTYLFLANNCVCFGNKADHYGVQVIGIR